MAVIEEILTRFQIEGTPLHIVEAVVMTAIDRTVHLDYVYFVLRREPHVWVRLLSESHNNINNNNDDDDGGGGDFNNGNDFVVFVDDDDDNGDGNSDSDNDNANDNDGGVVDSKNNRAGTRKRKRSV